TRISGPTSRGGFRGCLRGAPHKTASQPMAERGRTGTTELKTGCALQHPVPIVDVRGASRPSAFGIFSEKFEAPAVGPSRRFAAPQRYVRSRSEADMARTSLNRRD